VRAEIEALQRDGTLEICPARVSSVRWRPGGLAVKLRRKGVAVFEIFQPSLILNCTGPEHDVTAMDDPLLKNLLRKQLIVRSPAGGIAARDMAIAEGRNDGRILAIGPLLIGELLEATAVPELRELAKHVAERVCARLREPSLATL
jgi:uncharacterized NAD(P)/FAD-binding protein YdhS